MKNKLFLQTLLFCLLSINCHASTDQKTQKNFQEISCSAGIAHINFKGYKNGTQVRDYNGDGIILSALYKYQKPQRLYCRLNTSYVMGKMKDTYFKYSRAEKIQEWNSKAAVGYTFEFNNNWLLSPFVFAGWWLHWMKEQELPIQERTKHEGPVIGLGIHSTYKFKNWEIAFIAHIGMSIFQKMYGKYTSAKGIIKNHYHLKKRPFYEILLPINYSFDKWKLGIALHYSLIYLGYNTEKNYEKAKKQTYGASVDLTYPF